MPEHYDIVMSWVGKGFGEPLVLAHLTQIAIDNGIHAAWKPRDKAKDWMVAVPIFNKGGDSFNHVLSGQYELNGVPIFLQHLFTIERLLGVNLEVGTNFVPVTFEEEEVKEVDVLICSKTGDWTPYKNWAYFDDLKMLFDSNGITYADIHKDKIWSNKCLNYANKCKLYLGLDTGVSHYLSKFVNSKALIIQAGFVNFKFWSFQYDYDFIEARADCAPCYINKNDIAAGRGCKFNNACMRDISAEAVFLEALKRL
jgi:hypothetical protein